MLTTTVTRLSMRYSLRHKLPALLAALAVILTLGTTSPATADQNDPQLDTLFDALQRTTSDREVQQLTRHIWDRWTAFESDSDTYKMMVQGMALMDQGQLSHAETVFSAIIDDHPDYAEAWNKRATVRFMRGDDYGSRRDIAEVIDREPRHFGALSGLGMIHIRNGNLQGALQAFEAALRVNPHLANAQDMITRLRQELRGQSL